jgi:SAM-dependent methyltransferase
MHPDFDTYAHTYRATHSANIAVTGADSAYFARLKSRESVDRCGFTRSFAGTILDFGCGDGVLIKGIKTLLPQARCFGVDASAEMIDLAQTHGPSLCEFSRVENSLSMYPDDFFDLVVIANVFHHIDRTLWQLWLKELTRVTKNGGQLHFYEHNPLNPLMHLFVRGCPFDVGVRLIFPGELAKAIQSYPGLRLGLTYMLFFPRWVWLSRLTNLERYLSWFPLGGQYLLTVKQVF